MEKIPSIREHLNALQICNTLDLYEKVQLEIDLISKEVQDMPVANWESKVPDILKSKESFQKGLSEEFLEAPILFPQLAGYNMPLIQKKMRIWKKENPKENCAFDEETFAKEVFCHHANLIVGEIPPHMRLQGLKTRFFATIYQKSMEMRRAQLGESLLATNVLIVAAWNVYNINFVVDSEFLDNIEGSREEHEKFILEHYEYAPFPAFSITIRYPDGLKTFIGAIIKSADRTMVAILERANRYSAQVLHDFTKALVYLCAENSVVRDNESSSYVPTKKAMPRMEKEFFKRTTSKSRIIHVGEKELEEVRKVYDLQRNLSATMGLKKAPHVRKAHFHSFWRGPRKSEERSKVVHFLPLKLVNFVEESENYQEER